MIPGHDRLCPVVATDLSQCPQCVLIAKVRADERVKVLDSLRTQRELADEDQRLADLRTQVGALAVEHHYGGKHMWCVRRDSVLALLDGSSE